MKPIIDPLFSPDQLQTRVNDMAAQIAPYLQPDVVMISLLKGALIFAADLARALSLHNISLCLDFMVLSSYGSKTISSGTVTTRLDCSENLHGRQVLLVDDILDTGTTLAFAKQHIQDKGAAEILTCVLLDKPARRQVAVHADFVGFQVPNLFVVGYGIDYNHMFRELPFIGTLRS